MLKKKMALLLLSVFIIGILSAAISTGIKLKNRVDLEKAGLSPESTGGSSEGSEREVVTITYKDLCEGSSSEGFTAEEFENTPLGGYIVKRFGIRFEQIAASGNENREEMARDIASSQLADIIKWNNNPFYPTNYTIFFKAVQQGQIADITGAIEAVAPAVREAIAPERLPLYVRTVIHPEEFGGKVFQLPISYDIGEPSISGWGFYIRHDLAVKLQLELPHGWFRTPEDFYNLLVRVQGTNLRDSNGYRIWPGGGVTIWSLNAYINGYDFGGAEEIGLENGKVTGLFQTEWPWKQVLFIRRLINERLLDPEVFTQSRQIYLEKLKTGKYGLVPFCSSDPRNGRDIQEALEAPAGKNEWEYIPLGRIANYKGDLFYTVNKGVQDIQTLIFSKSAPVDRIMEFAEWTLSEEGRRIVTYGPDELQRAVKTENGYKWSNGMYDIIKTGEWYKTIEARIHNAAAVFTQVYGTDAPQTNVLFGGAGARNNSAYLNEPDNSNARTEQSDSAVEMLGASIRILDKLTFRMAGEEFEGMDKLTPVLSKHNSYDYEDVMKRCFIAKTEKEAREILDSYIKELTDNGYKEWIAYIQSSYEESPELYADYISPQ